MASLSRVKGRVRLAVMLLVLTGIAATVALAHLDNLPAYLMIAPGYLVQAWLFERHLALGGFGYQATMVGTSALVWTLILFGLTTLIRLVVRMLQRLSAPAARH
ncbi:MAG TPA: hypothetical protein VFP39_14715 [Gemmatimonadales bacterium]|nr:hypothetical protein [Gemmatimonadales bacterium]